MKMQSVVHFEMPAEDKARVAKFYTEVFGWNMQQLGPEMGNYVLAGTAESDERGPLKPGAINGGFFEKDASGPDQCPHVVIGVDSVGESMESVKKSGGEITSEPMDIPGIGLYVSFKDTEGNPVGMLQPVNSEEMIR